MSRMTIDKPTAEMNMMELAHNSCYAKERLARYRNYDIDVDARDFIRELLDVYKHGTYDDIMVDDDEFDSVMYENLQYDATTIDGLIALFYRNLWAMADLHSKLKHYEDLEEQVRLTEQPCKPGDKVWCIEEDDYAGYLFMGMCGDYAIVCSTYTWCADFDEQLECMVEETIEDGDTHVEIFHRSNVFLTKVEAEAKLAELKGEQGA